MPEQLTAKSVSMAEWIAMVTLLGQTDRDAYRVLRELMWTFVVENSERSDFPSDMS